MPTHTAPCQDRTALRRALVLVLTGVVDWHQPSTRTHTGLDKPSRYLSTLYCAERRLGLQRSPRGRRLTPAVSPTVQTVTVSATSAPQHDGSLRWLTL